MERRKKKQTHIVTCDEHRRPFHGPLSRDFPIVWDLLPYQREFLCTRMEHFNERLLVEKSQHQMRH